MKYEYLVYVTGPGGIARALDKFSAQGWRLNTLYGPYDGGGTEGIYDSQLSGVENVYGDDPEISYGKGYSGSLSMIFERKCES